MKNQWNPTFRFWILSILTLLFIWLLWVSRDLISPLVSGALLAFVLDPAIRFLTQRTRMSRSWAAVIVLFTGLGGLVAVSVLMVPRLIIEIRFLLNDLQEILTQAQKTLSQPINILGWEVDFEYLVPDLNRFFSEQFTKLPENAFNLLEATSKNLIWGLVIVATVFYLLRDSGRLRDWLFIHIPESYQPDAHRIYHEIKQIWHGYLRGNLALMVIVGVMFTLAWFAIGLPGALILGFITGLLTIIPDLGPAIAAALAVVVALFEGSSFLNISNFWFALLVFGIYLLLINIKGIWIRPRIFARSVHMHDGIVFVAIMAAVVLWGILGALVIIPALASIGVLLRYIYHQLIGSSSLSPDQSGATTIDGNEDVS
jgi:predicted PurR-regulated permease PerM